MYVYMYVRTYVRMYVCMFVCLYVIYIYIYLLTPPEPIKTTFPLFFCQGFSEDLPHHTARIFAQARVAS